MSEPIAAISTTSTPAPYESRARQGWFTAVIVLMATLAYVDRQVLALLVNPIKADMGLTDTQISLVIGAAFGLSNLVFTLPAGWLVDRFSRRAILGLGAIVWSCTTMLCGLTSTFAQLAGARSLVGFGEAVIQPGAFSMLRSAIPRERIGRAFSYYYMSSMVGSALALLAGGVLIAVMTSVSRSHLWFFGSFRPWQLTLIAVGLIGIPASALLTTVREPPRRNAVSVGRGSYADAFSHIRSRWKLYVPLWISMVSFVTVAAGNGAWVAAMMGRNYNLSASQVGLTLGLTMAVVAPIGLVVIGRIIDLAHRRSNLGGVAWVGVAVTVVMVIASVLVPQSPTRIVFICAITLSFLVAQGPMPVFAGIITAITPDHLTGKITGIQFFMTGLVSYAIGPTAIAWASDHLFTGRRSLANALSLTGLIGGTITLLFLLILTLQLRREIRRGLISA